MNISLCLLARRALQHHPVLRMYCSSETLIRKLVRSSVTMHYKRNFSLNLTFRDGHIYVVLDGLIAYKNADQQFIHFSQPGEILCTEIGNVDLIAMSSSKILEININKVRNDLPCISELSQLVQENNINQLNKMVHFHALQTEKKWAYLLKHNSTLYSKLSSKTIALYIGVSQQTVCRMRKSIAGK